jgi:hypothetical protein
MHLQADHGTTMLGRRVGVVVIPLLLGLLLGATAGGSLGVLLVISAILVAIAQQTLP